MATSVEMNKGDNGVFLAKVKWLRFGGTETARGLEGKQSF